MSKILDGLKLRGTPAEIPDTDRNDLPLFFKEMGYKVGLEVGTEKGRYTERLAEVGMKVYTVDPFIPYPGYDGDETLNVERMNRVEADAKKRTAKYDVTIIKKMSMDAVLDFEDNSLDFVYIDGNHGFRYVCEDVWEWHRKVKSGGVVSGHDYALGPWSVYSAFAIHVPYVIPVVAKILRIPNWYVLGEYKAKIGDKREKFRSWFYIKP